MSISADTLAKINKAGYTLASKPSYEIPSLPRDITELDDEALMDLFVQFTQWTDHLSGVHAMSVIDERELEKELSKAEANAMVTAFTGKGAKQVAVLKAHIANSPEVHGISEELDTKYAYRKLVETMMLNAERDAQVVSRELTRRTSEHSGLKSRSRRFTV